MLLGDVREVEVDRERAQDERLPLDIEPGDHLGHRPPRAFVAASTEPAEEADSLLEPEDVLPFLLDEHAAEDGAEQPNVRAKRGVGARRHDLATRRRRSGGVPARAQRRRRRRDSRGGGRRDEVGEQTRRDVGDLVDRPGERRLVRLRRLRRAAHLADVLHRSSADLVLGRRGGS